MRNSVVNLILLSLISFSALAQPVSEVLDLKKHRVIIQFNDSDSIHQIRLTQQLEDIRTSWPNAQIEVVCLDAGLDLLITANSKVVKDINDWSTKGVVFSACNATMRRRNVRRSDLLEHARVIPSAPVTLALKQEQGWAFFRGGD